MQTTREPFVLFGVDLNRLHGDQWFAPNVCTMSMARLRYRGCAHATAIDIFSVKKKGCFARSTPWPAGRLDKNMGQINFSGGISHLLTLCGNNSAIQTTRQNHTYDISKTNKISHFLRLHHQGELIDTDHYCSALTRNGQEPARICGNTLVIFCIVSRYHLLMLPVGQEHLERPSQQHLPTCGKIYMREGYESSHQ
jgi:hypothetical protein